MIYAEIQNGTVVNVIVAEVDFVPPVGKTFVAGDGAGIGDTYENGQFTPPPSDEPEIPYSLRVSAESARRLDAGFLLDDGTRFRCDGETRSMLAGFQSLPSGALPLQFVTAAGRSFQLNTLAEIEVLASTVATFVAEVLAASSALQAGPEVDFTDDVHWPAGSAGA